MTPSGEDFPAYSVRLVSPSGEVLDCVEQGAQEPGMAVGVDFRLRDVATTGEATDTATAHLETRVLEAGGPLAGDFRMAVGSTASAGGCGAGTQFVEASLTLGEVTVVEDESDLPAACPDEEAGDSGEEF